MGALVLAGMFTALRFFGNTTFSQSPLITLSGKTTDLRTVAAGKPTVVNLWATWCPPCRLELPYLGTAQRVEPGISFVFVDQGEDPVTVERYLAAVRLDLANVMLDPGIKLSSEMGSPGLPITMFYDANGRMIDTHLGALSPSLLEGKLAKLRPSKK